MVPGASGKFGAEFDVICGTGKFKSGANILGARAATTARARPAPASAASRPASRSRARQVKGLPSAATEVARKAWCRAIIRPTHELVFVSWTRTGSKPNWPPAARSSRSRERWGSTRRRSRTASRSTAWSRPHAARHAPRGGVDRETLVELVERGMSVRQIGNELGLSFGAVQHWLAKYELKTEPHHYSRRDAEKPPSTLRECATHGWTVYVRSGARGFYRCPKCAMERVAAYRRRVKELLVEEAGGRCRVLRLRRLHRRAAFPPPRPGAEAVRLEPRRNHADPSNHAGRGAEVRATVRKLPRGGRGGAGASGPPADTPG